MTAGGLSFPLNICVAQHAEILSVLVILWGFFLGKVYKGLLVRVLAACEEIILHYPPPHGGQKTAVSARL